MRQPSRGPSSQVSLQSSSITLQVSTGGVHTGSPAAAHTLLQSTVPSEPHTVLQVCPS